MPCTLRCLPPPLPISGIGRESLGGRIAHARTDSDTTQSTLASNRMRGSVPLSNGLGDAAGLQRAQDLYALFYGRMGGEEAFGTLLELLYGVDDVEVGGRAVGCLQDLLVTGNLL